MVILAIIAMCVAGGGLLFRMIKKRKSKSDIPLYSLNHLINDIRKKAEETIDKQHLKVLYNNTLMIKRKFSHKKESADAKNVLKLIQDKIYEQSELAR